SPSGPENGAYHLLGSRPCQRAANRSHRSGAAGHCLLSRPVMTLAPIVTANPSGIDLAVRALAAGELIGLPTETVYGLAADASNPDAVARIFSTKGRPADHPVIVHVADNNDL